MRVDSITLGYYGINKKCPCNKPINNHTKPAESDSVCFKGIYQNFKVNVPLSEAQLIAKDITSTLYKGGGICRNADTARLITLGIAEYAKSTAKKNNKAPLVMIGRNPEKDSSDYMSLIKSTLMGQNVNVMEVTTSIQSNYFSKLIKNRNADAAVHIITPEVKGPVMLYEIFDSEGKTVSGEPAKQIGSYIEDIAKAGIYSEKLDAETTYLKLDLY